MRRYLAPMLGRQRLQRLALTDVRSFHSELMTLGMKPATVRRVHATLHRALSDAVDDGLIPANPASLPRKRRLPTGQPYEFVTWTADELRVFLEHVRQDPLYAGYFLAAYTGLRRGEVLGLEWRDVDLDFDRGSLSVRRARIAVHHEVLTSETKTTNGVRVVELDAETVAVLRAHKARQNEERLACGPAWEETGLVLTAQNGAGPHPDTFSKTFVEHVKAAGLPRIRLHDLRHTWATIAGKSGVPLKVIQERLGHHSPMFTAKQYQHVLPGMQREAAEKFAELIRKGSDETR